MRLVTLSAILLLLAPASVMASDHWEDEGRGRSGPVHLTSEVSVAGANFSRAPVSSAPDLYVGSCNRGFTLQGDSRGGGIGGQDPVCTFLSLAASAKALGLDASAQEYFNRAADEATSRHRFTRFFSWIPLIGGLF